MRREEWRPGVEIFGNIPRERAAELIKRLLGNRIILLMETVDDSIAELVISQMDALEEKDPAKGIDLYLNSNGGAVAPSLAIHECMQASRAPISTICLKRVAGTASLLLAAGEKGKRYILRGSQVVLSQLHIKGYENVEEMPEEQLASQLVKTYEDLALLFEKHTGQNRDKIYHDMMKGTILTDEEALEYGLADGIIEKSPIG